jgi:PAS domain S-box-containing protein
VLLGGSAFFEGWEHISRQQWRHFAQRQKLETQLAGIQGLGFARLIPRAQLAQHILDIRAEGFPSYRVRPPGERELYTSIIYLEPFSGRNLRAFGYDMLSEPVRREAMQRARDQDSAALSGKVVLVQETDEAVQAGTLMYVPVYRAGSPTATVHQRRAALRGWVYSPYRMNDLMRGILGGWDLVNDRRLRLQVFDGDMAEPGALLYDSHAAAGPPPGNAPRMRLQSRMVTAGRSWTLSFATYGSRAATADYGKVWLVLFGGGGISLLLAWLLFNLLNTKLKARQLAEHMTAELRQSENKYRQLFEMESDALFLIDTQSGKILDANKAAVCLYGYSLAELLTMKNEELSQEPEKSMASRAGAAASGRTNIPLRYHRKKDGTVFPAEINATALKLNGAQVIIPAIRDITERRRTEQEKERLAAVLVAQKQEMENFLYITTHDLRTPLVNILGFSQSLLADLEHLLEAVKPESLPVKMREALSGPDSSIPAAMGFIAGSAKKMDQVINGILKVYRQDQVPLYVF